MGRMGVEVTFIGVTFKGVAFKLVVGVGVDWGKGTCKRV